LNAERFGFQDKGKPGLSAKGHAHGCNDVHGGFQVLAFPINGKGSLSVDFTQRCDNVPTSLLGEIRLQP